MDEKDKYRERKSNICNPFWVERDYCSYKCRNRNHCSNCPFAHKRIEEKQKQLDQKEKQRLRILKEDLKSFILFDLLKNLIYNIYVIKVSVCLKYIIIFKNE